MLVVITAHYYNIKIMGARYDMNDWGVRYGLEGWRGARHSHAKYSHYLKDSKNTARDRLDRSARYDPLSYASKRGRVPKKSISSSSSSSQSKSWVSDLVLPDTHDTKQLAAGYRRQRNKLSAMLNDMMRTYGRLSCQMKTLAIQAGKDATRMSDVSARGGWCAKDSAAASTQHYWDSGLNRALSRFLKGKTVGSFGEGPGMYHKRITALGEVTSYTSYDGAPYCEVTTNGVVKFLDLTAPAFGLPAFDWVISLEVGEHIDRNFENIYLDNLVRHAKEGIILSWAKVGQDGFSHVNNKPLEEVVALMDKRGFTIHVADGAPLRDASSVFWLQDNIHVYRRKATSRFKYEDV